MTQDLDNLVAELAEDATAVTPAPHPYRLGLKWLAGAAGYLALLLALTGLRHDWAHALAQPMYDAELLMLALMLVSGTVSAALLAFPDMHQKRALVLVPLWLSGAFWLLITGAAYAQVPGVPLPVHSFQCTLSISLVALPPAAGLFYAMRKFASTHYYLAGAIALLSAFSVGALWLRLEELNDSIPHVIEWHYLPMLAAGLAGVGLGRLLLKW